VKDFDEWNKVKKETDNLRKQLILKEGEIRWSRVGLNIGTESLGKGKFFSRPVLILKKFSSDSFWGIPLTTKKKSGSWYFHLKSIDRTLILNQMRVFDRKRLEDLLFVISKKDLDKVKEQICVLIKS
jgi:mRNA interferase MazF